jgi:hypothetical protein
VGISAYYFGLRRFFNVGGISCKHGVFFRFLDSVVGFEFVSLLFLLLGAIVGEDERGRGFVESQLLDCALVRARNHVLLSFVGLRC